MSFIVMFVSTVPLNVAGSAVLLTVVPDTPVQLKETSSFGGLFDCIDLACHSYVILHIRVASNSSGGGRTTSHTGSVAKPFELLLF